MFDPYAPKPGAAWPPPGYDPYDPEDDPNWEPRLALREFLNDEDQDGGTRPDEARSDANSELPDDPPPF